MSHPELTLPKRAPASMGRARLGLPQAPLWPWARVSKTQVTLNFLSAVRPSPALSPTRPGLMVHPIGAGRAWSCCHPAETFFALLHTRPLWPSPVLSLLLRHPCAPRSTCVAQLQPRDSESLAVLAT